MKYQVVLTPGEDGWIVVTCPVLPGCISQGKTRDEALVNIKDAMQGWLEVRAMRLAEGEDDCPILEGIVEIAEVEVDMDSLTAL